LKLLNVYFGSVASVERYIPPWNPSTFLRWVPICRGCRARFTRWLCDQWRVFRNL